MKKCFVFLCLIVVAACSAEPKKTPTPEQKAEIVKAQEEYLAANCALFKKTSGPIPEYCEE